MLDKLTPPQQTREQAVAVFVTNSRLFMRERNPDFVMIDLLKNYWHELNMTPVFAEVNGK
jgi:hypothetical protein